MSLAIANFRPFPIPHGKDKAADDKEQPSGLSIRFENLTEALKMIAVRIYSAAVWVLSASLHTVSFNNFTWAGETAEDAWDDMVNYGGSLKLRCHRIVDPQYVDDVIDKIGKKDENNKPKDQAEKPHKEKKKHKPAEKPPEQGTSTGIVLAGILSDVVQSVKDVVDYGLGTVSQATGLFVYSATSRRTLRSALKSACADHQKKYHALVDLTQRVLFDRLQWKAFDDKVAEILSDCQKQAECELDKYVDKYTEEEIKGLFGKLVTSSIENLKAEIDANATSYLGAVKRGVLNSFFDKMLKRYDIQIDASLTLHKWLFDAKDVIENVENNLDAVVQFRNRWSALWENVKKDEALGGEAELIGQLKEDLEKIRDHDLNEDPVIMAAVAANAHLQQVMHRLNEHAVAIGKGEKRPGALKDAPVPEKRSQAEKTAEVIALMSEFDSQVREFSHQLLGINGLTRLGLEVDGDENIPADVARNELMAAMDAWSGEPTWFMKGMNQVGGWLSVGLGFGWNVVLAWPSSLLDGMGRLSPHFLKGAVEWVGFASEGRKYADGISDWNQFVARKCIDIPVTAFAFVCVASVGQLVARYFGYLNFDSSIANENTIVTVLNAVGGVARFIDSTMPESWSRLAGIALVSATWWQLPKWRTSIVGSCVALYGVGFYVDFSSYADLFGVAKLAINSVGYTLSTVASVLRVGSGYWEHILWLGGVLYCMNYMRPGVQTLVAVATKVGQVSGAVASDIGKGLSYVKKGAFG